MDTTRANSGAAERSVERMKMEDVQVSKATDALRKTCNTLPPEEAKIAVDTLSKIIQNVLVYPTEEKYRQVSFHQEVWRHPTAQEFFTLIGWAKIAVDTLTKIIQNALVYPTEEKHRQVKTTSNSLHQEVWRHPTAQEFLTLIGWTLVDGEKIIILQSIELIRGAFAALVRAKIYLEQPDLFPLGITNIPRVVHDFQVLFPQESALIKGVVKHAPLFPQEL